MMKSDVSVIVKTSSNSYGTAQVRLLRCRGVRFTHCTELLATVAYRLQNATTESVSVCHTYTDNT